MNHQEDPLNQLRELLLQSEIDKIDAIESKLDNPEQLAHLLGSALPEAVLLRNTKDQKMSKVLAPTIEEAIKTSVARDPGHLVDAITPIMGPSIRRAISDTFKNMLQNFNKTLENSFSIQGLKWRFDAIRTGSTFAEVVLLNSLIYRVEQIFLVHRKTGLPVQHVVAEDITAKDADMVSGMLTAIQDFAHDSFVLNESESIESLRIGDLNVVIEPDQELYLAAVVRGESPPEFRQILKEALTQVKTVAGKQVAVFQGDTAEFDIVNPILNDCLIRQEKTAKQKFSLKFWLIALGLIVLLGFAGFKLYDRSVKWSTFVNELQSEPGYKLTAVEKQWNRCIIEGFRDDLATNPEEILDAHSVDNESVEWRLEPYYALTSEFVLMRVNKILNPPESIVVSIASGVLTMKGNARHQWITDVQSRARLLPGILDLDLKQVRDLDLQDLHTQVNQLEKMFIQFELGSTEIPEDQLIKLDEIRANFSRIDRLLSILNRHLFVTVCGHADESGTKRINDKISRERALTIERIVASDILRQIDIKAVGQNDPNFPTNIPDSIEIQRFIRFQTEIR